MATTATPFDFSAVEVETAELPPTGAGRKRKHTTNPFKDVLSRSYEDFVADSDDRNPGRQVVVPAKAASEAVYLIRQAASDLKIGSRVILRDAKGKNVELKGIKSRGNANITVLFSAKNPRQSQNGNTESDENGDESGEE